MNSLSLKNRLALLRLGQGARGKGHGCCPGCGATPLQFSRPSRLRGKIFSFASPEDIDLVDLFNLPPEKAIEYFKSKGYAFSWNWQDVWQEAQALAFTVAKAMRMDVLQTIRDELQTALDDGMMLRDFQKDLEPKLKELGWWGKHEIVDADGVVSSVQLGSPWRLRNIYETNLQTSYMAGKYSSFMDNTAYRPYWQYQTMHDSQVRPSHRALDGLVFAYDDPFWDTHFPPNDWGCRCSVRALSDREVQQRGLDVSAGEGHLHDETIMSDGEEKIVTVYSDGNIRMAPGAGWNYNPGKTAWQPDLSKYSKDIARLG